MSTCQTPYFKTMIGCASPRNLVDHFGTWLFETFSWQPEFGCAKPSKPLSAHGFCSVFIPMTHM